MSFLVACESGVYKLAFIYDNDTQKNINDIQVDGLIYGSFFGIANSLTKIFCGSFFRLNCPLNVSQLKNYSTALKSLVIIDKQTQNGDFILNANISESTHYLCIGNINNTRKLIAQETYAQTIRTFDLTEDDEIIANTEQSFTLFTEAVNHHFVNAPQYQDKKVTTDGYRHMNAIQIMPDGNILVCCCYLGKFNFGKAVVNKPLSTFELFDNSWKHLRTIQLPDNIAHDIILDVGINHDKDKTTFWYAADKSVVEMSYPTFQELRRIQVPMFEGAFIKGIGKGDERILIIDEKNIYIINIQNEKIQTFPNIENLIPRCTVYVPDFV